MDARLTVLTLGVRDLDASRRFYVDGLGWTPTLDVPDEVVFIQVGHGMLLALWGADALAADAPGTDALAAGRGELAPPVSLGHNVGTEGEVDAALAAAAAAGGEIVSPARRQPWGGVSGYFADPDGFRWEIVYNPGLIVDADGTVRFVEVS